jgi:hypothetical protein
MASRTIEEHEAELTELRSRATEIDSEYAGQALPDEIRSEWDQVNLDIEEKTELIGELRAREERVRSLSAEPSSREQGAHFQTRRQPAVEDIWDIASVRAQSRRSRRRPGCSPTTRCAPSSGCSSRTRTPTARTRRAMSRS